MGAIQVHTQDRKTHLHVVLSGHMDFSMWRTGQKVLSAYSNKKRRGRLPAMVVGINGFDSHIGGQRYMGNGAHIYRHKPFNEKRKGNYAYSLSAWFGGAKTQITINLYVWKRAHWTPIHETAQWGFCREQRIRPAIWEACGIYFTPKKRGLCASTQSIGA